MNGLTMDQLWEVLVAWVNGWEWAWWQVLLAWGAFSFFVCHLVFSGKKNDPDADWE